MNAIFLKSRSEMLHVSTFLFCSVVFFVTSGKADALCGLDGAAIVPLEGVKNSKVARELRQQIDQINRVSNSQGSICIVCHQYGGGGPRNEFGTAANVLLSIKDREAFPRSRKVGLVLSDIPANPTLPDSPTFGQLFEQGRLPASSFAIPELPPVNLPKRQAQTLTVEQASQLVKDSETKSPWEILQLSRVEVLTPEAANALAEFRGEMLILGVRSLSPELAAVLAKSKVAGIWLHSLTSVSPEAANSLVKFSGDLVLTGLTELDFVPLAEKLAARPAHLSFPYLKKISPEIARVLAKNTKGLTLNAITNISVEVQNDLGKTTSILYLPNLTSLDSLDLAEILISGPGKVVGGTRVFLPKVQKLTAEQAKLLTSVRNPGLFFGGIFLSIDAVTPEVVDALARNRNGVRLFLVGKGPIRNESLDTLLRAGGSLILRDLEELSPEQAQIAAKAAADNKGLARFDVFAPLSMPSLKKLDSPLLVEAIGLAGSIGGTPFPSVTSISNEVADALGKRPEQNRYEELSFPSLEELSPETARLLVQRSWQSLSFPALQDYSVEMIRGFSKQTTGSLTLGLTSLPEELAAAMEDGSSAKVVSPRALIFPNLADLSPESARILVKRFNKELRIINANVRITQTPTLYFGKGFNSVASGIPTIKPAVAAELAKYNGILHFSGLDELPGDSAEALSTFQGPYLFLDGPGVRKLTEEAAARLAKIPGKLEIELLELDSVPLAEKFARQGIPRRLEVISKETIPALVQHKGFFDLRQITQLDSPELAKRLLGNSWGPTLPALSRLSPDAAAIVATSPHSVLLGLEYLDSPTVARSLTQVAKGVTLPRLRAATLDVIAILKGSELVKVDQIDSLYLLPEVKK